VLVVNIIPKALSSEEQQDSEPHLTVNPATPNLIAATAFTSDPGGSANAPIFVSRDGGNTWLLNSIVPSTVGSATHDITTSFSGSTNALYSGILRAPTSNLEFLGTSNFDAPTTMAIFKSRANADQPFTHAATVPSGPDKGKQRVYIGSNDFNAPNGQTSTIDQSMNVGASSPSFATVRLEKRSTVGQNGPQTRPVAHADGTVYAAFYRWRAMTGNFGANTLLITSADVVVVRDDKWGSGSAPYTALIDPGDGVAGIRVAQGVSFPFMVSGTASTGQQRLGESISIAVDLRNSSTVYLAYCDKQPGSMLTLHLRRSTDRGKTWSADLVKIDSATNGAVAVNSGGKIGLLYQQFKNSSGNPRWLTILTRSANGVNWTDLVLANVPSNRPQKSFDPYIGDYDHLVSVGADFYGIFSTANMPDQANFPNGVKYQRNANFTTRQLFRLDNSTPVAASIDPFFFRITEAA
jgi:hypothetical protein